MLKILAYLLLILVAVVAAAVFGVVHDQVGFAISHEYFTKFRFVQYGLVMNPLSERAKVALIGLETFWWAGIPIGGLVGLAGFFQPTWKQMIWVTLKSYGVVIAVAVVTGLVGLGYGCALAGNADLLKYRGLVLPSDLENPRAFLCAGWMHSSSYLGGALGIVGAWIYQLSVRRRSPQPAGEPPA